MMNRKAFNGDVTLLMVFLFTLGLVVTVGADVFERLDESFTGGEILSDDSAQQFSESATRFSTVWDGAFMLVFGLFAIALILSTVSLGSRPEFFFITVFVGIFFVGMAAILSNLFGEFFAAFSADGFTFIPLVLNNLVEAVLLLLALLVFGLFVKVRS